MRDLERATGVGRETIRFYIRERLLPEPARPRRNVAHYSGEHVVRIRAIKRLQEDERLQLSEIRQVLVDGNANAIAEGRGPELAQLIAELLGEAIAPRQTLAAVVDTGVSEEEIRTLSEAGIITLHGGDLLDDLDVRICAAWGKANALGFNDENGFDADFLQHMQEHVEAIANDQVARYMRVRLQNRLGEDAAHAGAEGLLLSREILGVMQLRAVFAALRDRPGAD